MAANFTGQSSSLEMEEYLRAAFRQLNWIGELDLPPKQFELLCKTVRLLGKQGDVVNVQRIPDLLLMTTMVFTARYAEFADDETPSFWRPYARMVWRLDDADQNFQQTCRRRFRSARARLEDEYDLFFPHKIDWHDQEVVSGIYMHAILPSYLEDDFAQWLVGLWKQGETWARSADLPVEVVAAHMRHHPSLENIRRRLKNFIQGNETYETAARLVQTLAAVAEEFERGANAQDLASTLSLVERAVWTELHAALIRDHEQLPRGSSGTRAQPVGRVELAWNVETGELALQARHLRGSGASLPDRLIWAESVDKLPDYRHFVAVNPWSGSEGWTIDTTYLDSVGIGGVIALVDEQDQVLGEPLAVPEPPSANVLFFRLIGDGSYGVLTDPYRLSNGDYIVSASGNVQLKDARTGEVLLPTAKFEPPDALYHRSHRTAARYNLRLPIDVISNGDTLRLKPRRTNLIGILQGNLVPGLAEDTIPVFTESPRLCLLNAASLVDELHHLRLRVIPTYGQTLEMLLTRSSMQVVGEDLVIDLATCLPNDGGLYSLTLLQNVTRTLPEPIQFAVLPPWITVEVPPSDGYFTVDTPPSVTICGIHPDAVYTDTGVKQIVDDAIVVEWRQVWQPLRLQLAWKESRIPLQWSVLWRHAWLDPFNETLTLEELGTSTIHLHGAPHETFVISVGDESRRSVALNARGESSFVIAGDQLKDMLRESYGARAEVTASDGRTTWLLFTFIRSDTEHLDGLYPLVRKALDAARHLSGQAPKTQSRGRITQAVLLALPEKELNTFGAEQAGSAAPILISMQSVRTLPRENLTPWALPPTYPLIACIDGVSECLNVDAEQLPVSAAGYGQATLMLSLPTADHAERQSKSLQVTWTRDSDTGETVIRACAPGSVLKVCSICGRFFLENTSTKIQHSHGKGWNIQHQDPSIGLTGTLTLDADKLLARWKPTLAPAMDRETIRSFRLHKERAARCQPAPFYTIDGYRYAVAEWALNLNNSELRAKLEEIIGSEFAINAASLRLRLIKARKQMSRLPLIYLSYLLEDVSVETNNSWTRLDLSVLILAGMCRAMAYNIYEDLPSPRGFADDQLLAILDKAIDACPSLTAWAFSWAELFFSTFSKASIEK